MANDEKDSLGADAAAVDTARSASDSDQLPHAETSSTGTVYDLGAFAFITEEHTVRVTLEAPTDPSGNAVAKAGRLFKAAPELYEALKGMVARFYRDGGTLLTADAVVTAEAAIAKAEGR